MNLGKLKMFNSVVIIGSGPAGTAAAISCAKKGIQTTIIENDEFIRQRPGETLHPGIEPLLKQLGVAKDFLSADFLRHKGNWVHWEDELRFVPFGNNDDLSEPWMGFQVCRPDFDNILLNRAKDLGVKVIQSCRALRPIVNNKSVIGIETSKGSIQTSFVIDATGGQHWLARMLGLKIQNYSPPLLVHYGYVEGNCSLRNDAPCIVADKCGWVWTARIKPNLYHWTRLFFSKQQIDGKSVPNEFQDLKQKGNTMGADVTWRIVSEPSGFGYFITGDAVAVLDPASSHGILKAIMSGMMAAHMIANVIDNNSLQHQAIKEYNEWIKSSFIHDVVRLKKLYAKHPAAPSWIRHDADYMSLIYT